MIAETLKRDQMRQEANDGTPKSVTTRNTEANVIEGILLGEVMIVQGHMNWMK